jgi:hypothetical protein
MFAIGERLRIGSSVTEVPVRTSNLESLMAAHHVRVTLSGERIVAIGEPVEFEPDVTPESPKKPEIETHRVAVTMCGDRVIKIGEPVDLDPSDAAAEPIAAKEPEIEPHRFFVTVRDGLVVEIGRPFDWETELMSAMADAEERRE